MARELVDDVRSLEPRRVSDPAADARKADEVAADARKADQDARKSAAETVERDGKAAQEASEEVLNEQAGMVPVPSQADANKMRAGGYDPLKDAQEVKQPDGPAARASASTTKASTAEAAPAASSYRNRADKSA